jgi:CubicO group peptidase (beta-lactamase class C family)
MYRSAFSLIKCIICPWYFFEMWGIIMSFKKVSMWILLFLLIATVSFIYMGSTSHQELKGNLKQKLSKFMDKKANDLKFNGVVLIAKDGKAVFEKGYGFANIANGTPDQINTEFRIASLTKSFTAISILQLEEEGKLKTTDFISNYIPSFKNGDKITIHHLLTHSSGVADHFKMTDTTKPIILSSFINLMSKQKLSFTPGTKYSYSNEGYMILAYIIEKVSGENYEEYYKEHIFKVAGMNHTYLKKAEAKRMAVGYRNMNKDDMKDDESQLAGAGDIISTVGDLLRYNNAIHNNKILSPQEVEKMEAGYIDVDKWGAFRYGYGWKTAKSYISFYRPMVEHNGNLPGFKSEVTDFVKDRVTVILLSNNNGKWNSGALSRELASICLDKRFWYFQKYF